MKNILKKLAILFIRFYQLAISPMIGNNCRHFPTCSKYGIEALEKHGAFKGVILTIIRVIKCNPFGTNGIDPVPEEWPKNKLSKK